MFSVSQSPSNASSTSILALPSDCIRHTMLFTDEGITLNMLLVCRLWYQSVDRMLSLSNKYYHVPREYQHRLFGEWCLSSSIPVHMKDQEWSHIQIVHMTIDAQEVESLPPSIERLSINSQCEEDDEEDTNSAVTACPLHHNIQLELMCRTILPNCSNLCILDLSGTCVIDSTIHGLGRYVPMLEELDLSSTRISDVSCFSLEAIPTLQTLTLFNTKITTVSHLSQCRGLQILDLGHCRRLTDDGIRGLEHIPTLQQLVLSHTNITNVSHLTSSVSLRKLDIFSNSHLTNAGIRGLGNIPTLEYVDMSETDISDISDLSSCRNLRKLVASNCHQ
eukprot:PhF_6_TR21194/c3_g1_i4/m.30573